MSGNQSFSLSSSSASASSSESSLSIPSSPVSSSSALFLEGYNGETLEDREKRLVLRAQYLNLRVLRLQYVEHMNYNERRRYEEMRMQLERMRNNIRDYHVCFGIIHNRQTIFLMVRREQPLSEEEIREMEYQIEDYDDDEVAHALDAGRINFNRAGNFDIARFEPRFAPLGPLRIVEEHPPRAPLVVGPEVRGTREYLTRLSFLNDQENRMNNLEASIIRRENNVYRAAEVVRILLEQCARNQRLIMMNYGFMV